MFQSLLKQNCQSCPLRVDISEIAGAVVSAEQSSKVRQGIIDDDMYMLWGGPNKTSGLICSILNGVRIVVNGTTKLQLVQLMINVQPRKPEMQESA